MYNEHTTWRSNIILLFQINLFYDLAIYLSDTQFDTIYTSILEQAEVSVVIRPRCGFSPCQDHSCELKEGETFKLRNHGTNNFSCNLPY
jgi:hypothetical protein